MRVRVTVRDGGIDTTTRTLTQSLGVTVFRDGRGGSASTAAL